MNTKNVVGMRLIPGGEFKMGAEGWGEFESPIHEVYVDEFLMDETSVTNEQFSNFIAKTGYKTTAEIIGFSKGYIDGVFQEIKDLSWKTYATDKRSQHPVVLVSWHDAKAFSEWADKRLPTEAEWEKAARGGLVQELYPWGNNEPKPNNCNYGKTTISIPPTTEVGYYKPNEYGLHDMCGNVWNWCNDWFSENYYSLKDFKNPQGPKTGTTKVRRGASFNIIQPFRLRTSNRGAYIPDYYAINIGFRCVKNLI